MTNLLEISSVRLRFGGHLVLDDVSFAVPRGGVFAIIGPNGAGKTSLFNVITRVYQPQAGRVTFAAGDQVVDLLGARPHQLAKLGVARTFQNLQLIHDGTVLDNVVLGRHHLYRTSVIEDLISLGRARRQERQHVEAARGAIDLLDLSEWADRPISSLPYGVQKRVEMARAIALESRLLLLDEPAAGLNSAETDEIMAAMRTISDDGRCTQVLIDHDMRFVSEVADRIVVLDYGRVLAEGTPAEIARNADVIRAYLGGSASVAGT